MPGLQWTVPCNEGMKVTSAQLKHRVPCWGYVFKEPPRPPREIPDRVKAVGFQPGEAQGMLRQGLKPGSQIATPSGKTLPLQTLFTPPVPGRKVVLLGDTCNSASIEGGFLIITSLMCLRAELPCHTYWPAVMRSRLLPMRFQSMLFCIETIVFSY